VSGNVIFSGYLNVPHLPGVDELFPIAGAVVGALLAYLWYNSPPAEIYMGDAGSIGLGATIGVMFILVQASLFLPIVGIVILAEAVSVVGQQGYFKILKKTKGLPYARKMQAEGKLLFLKAPLHHHFQVKWAGRIGDSKPLLNSKIAWRMHLVSIIAFLIGCVIFFGVR
jgi:phospho-N-acetylmuramoyl-pentapeptide-transferase